MYEVGDRVTFTEGGLEKNPTASGVEIYTVTSRYSSKMVYDVESETSNTKIYAVYINDIIAYGATASATAATTAVATVPDIDPHPTRHIMRVQYPSDYHATRSYEYYAFGTFEELSAATHAVVSKEVHEDINDLLSDTELKVVRILEVYPSSRQRFDGKLKWVIDFIDGTEYITRVEREKQATRLRRDIHARLDKVKRDKELASLAETDPEAKKMFELLKEIENE